MLFRGTNIRVEFSDEEKEMIEKVHSILETLEKKIKEDSWRSLGIDGAVYYEEDDINCAIGILEVLTDDKVEIILG